MKSIISAYPKEMGLAKDLVVGFLASIVLGFAAIAALPLPFTPVPLALQPNMMLLLAALLGPRRGAIMVASFLLQGGMGFPVFALGASGILHLMGPRGGYLFGYFVAAIITGALYQRSNKTKMALFNSMAIGNATYMLLGMFWLSNFFGMKGAFTLGVLPFVIGDFLKLVFFASVSSLKEKILKQFGCPRDL